MMPTLIHGPKAEPFPENPPYTCELEAINTVVQVSAPNENTVYSCTMNTFKDELDQTISTSFFPDIKTVMNNMPRQPLHIVPGNHNIVVPVPSNPPSLHSNELLQGIETSIASQNSFNSQIFLQHDVSAFRPKTSMPNSTLPSYCNQEVIFDANHNKPSEALFVRCLLTRCKRIAPLWFRSVTSMRERNRGEQRKPSILSNQSQDDWTDISDTISQMDSNEESDSVVNLLKKLYKELPPENVLWFLKCWLCSADTVAFPDKCVISRGDAKNRMRRIDCGKGSDKVWRLDTIVGMLFHGLPMSSTDTAMMIHTCKNDLCVRPQHLRFRANSVSLVVVLKALAQAGYVVMKPGSDQANPLLGQGINCRPNNDEFVDVYGPFSIEKLQQYRSENLLATGPALSRLALNPSDSEFINSVDVFREVLDQSKQPFSNLVGGSSHKCSRKKNLHVEDSIEGGRKSLKRSATSASNSPGNDNHDSSPSVASYTMHEHSPAKQQATSSYDYADGRIKTEQLSFSPVPRQPAKKRMEARTPIDELAKTTETAPSIESLLPQSSKLIEVGNDLMYGYMSLTQQHKIEQEDEEELIMIQGNCSETTPTPRKSISAEPKSRNEMLAAAYLQKLASDTLEANRPLSSSSSELPKLGGSPSSGNSNCSLIS
ncbi:hypothetical protein Ciccas_004615 [Cichlidogyrus casuarinus]|uniref:CTF/NF-I domain-containing protein n=1 Tax=Cichlidogyrus casuarinus TaxID=1844966 RepID=A0ABD2QDB9_9PLAT